MINELRNLYKQLLELKYDDGRSVFDRINSKDLCLSGHHRGGLYNNGLMIYGQAMNGWENETDTIDGLVDTVLTKADDDKELFTLADYAGWHGKVDGEDKSYYYKRSKFWKLNYCVITNCNKENFDDFYIKRTSEDEKEKLLQEAWPQNIVWSNLYKISFSQGGNPDWETIELTKDICLKIILKEIEMLKPSKILFNTGELLFSNIALQEENIFGLTKVENNNILYVGEYEYAPNQKCKIVVCRRPDAWNPVYKNIDIVNEGKAILEAFEAI